MDFFGGYSLKLKKDFEINHKPTFLVFNAGVNNILNNKDIVTGGYEQLRYDAQTGVWHKNVLLQVIDKGYGSLGFQVKETREKENSLPAKDMSSIMQDWGKTNIDIVKLDIEGSEEQVILEDKSNWPQKAKTIFVEIHDNLKPGLTEKIVAKLQTDFNFHKNGEYMVFTKKINA